MSPVQGYESVSRSTLEDSERRAITFLKAAGSNTRVRNVLEAAGYSKKVHAEGFRLYFEVVGFSPIVDAATTGTTRSAFDTIEAWQGSGFARARAALRHKHPEVEQFVFAGLTAVRGAGALGAMATFLSRCEALENSPERKATRKGDKAALATLEERGITKAVRDDLHAKLDLATVDAEADTAGHVAPDDVLKRQQDLYALYLWIQDWTDTARAVITSRVDLISLGVAKRRRAKQSVVTPPAPPAPPPVVVVTPPPPPTQPQMMLDEAPPSRAA